MPHDMSEASPPIQETELPSKSSEMTVRPKVRFPPNVVVSLDGRGNLALSNQVGIGRTFLTLAKWHERSRDGGDPKTKQYACLFRPAKKDRWPWSLFLSDR